MSRYYALVLIPGDTPEEEAEDAALDLLYPYMQGTSEGPEEFKFDYMLGPAEIAALSDDDSVQNVWPVSEIVDTLADLQLEAIVAPDGTWHEAEPGEMWDDPAWVVRVRKVLEQHRDCLALRHVLHT
ncbi:MAG: hypothetical protein AVDCRST_MAG26-2540 [uncultured Chloroflexia bacterium]|uniref:Uncharacterized protein n=1 Tax=uncultured Chloroflexia bacterium TaxID=1672391 RepID=A0A6J4IZW4_9CHLR|nr:MAG: hypothetical protein AVDCRST_MAG26-2540 [uncultured Chloroflexia bacterium]